jgi:hypothetical protein
MYSNIICTCGWGDDDGPVGLGPAAQVERVGDVDVRLRAALVVDEIALLVHPGHLPLRVVVHQLEVGLCTLLDLQVDLLAVVGPRAERHDALLDVEGPVVQIDLAERVELGRRHPQHLTVVLHNAVRVAVVVHLASLRAETTTTSV